MSLKQTHTPEPGLGMKLTTQGWTDQNWFQVHCTCILMQINTQKCWESGREKITDKTSACSRSMWTGSSSSWNHNKGKDDLQFTLQICVKDKQQNKTECWSVNLALKSYVHHLCTQWMKLNSTQTRDLCTRVIFSCKLQLMSGHVQRALPVSKTIYQPAAQIHRLGDKRWPVRIPGLCRKSTILLFSPYSHPHVISTFCRAGQCGVQAAQVQAPRAAVCKPPGPHSPLPDPAFGAAPGMLPSPLPTGFYAQTPHCPQALQLQAALGHAPGCGPDKSPSANSCSRETGRNQLYQW